MTFQPKAFWTPSRFLAGKTALVTGSTSGIGLGIAWSLASAGANIVLNGFGDADAIEKARGDIESQFSVQASYCAADISQGDEI